MLSKQVNFPLQNLNEYFQMVKVDALEYRR